MEDESYFTLTWSNVQRNRGYYSSDRKSDSATSEKRCGEKYCQGLLVWAAISERELSFGSSYDQSNSLFGRETGNVFIESNHESVSSDVFWHDTASVHYARLVTEWLEFEEICFVRPIETFRAILKMKVYEADWSAKTRLNWKKEFCFVPKSSPRMCARGPKRCGRRSQNSDQIMLSYRHSFELYFFRVYVYIYIFVLPCWAMNH